MNNDLEKGKSLPIGTEKNRGGNIFVKTADGWKYKRRASKGESPEQGGKEKAEGQSVRDKFKQFQEDKKKLPIRKQLEQGPVDLGDGKTLVNNKGMFQVMDGDSVVQESKRLLDLKGHYAPNKKEDGAKEKKLSWNDINEKYPDKTHYMSRTTIDGKTKIQILPITGKEADGRDKYGDRVATYIGEEGSGTYTLEGSGTKENVAKKAGISEKEFEGLHPDTKKQLENQGKDKNGKTKMTIQGLNFKKGDKFQVGNDSSVYTFINVTTNKKYGFQELNAENEFDSVSSFRIDNMLELGLNISKVY